MITKSSSPPHTYGWVSIALHWLMGFAIVAIFSLGLFMADLPLSPNKLRLYSWHKWAGVTIFLLAITRLAWRLTHPVSRSVSIPAWQHVTAEWTHRLLYLLMFAVPLSGWIMSSAQGVPTVYFGLWQLPDLVGRNIELGRRLQDLHIFLNYLMAGIVSIHMAAALKHHFIDRDDVLVRMLPFLRK